MGKLVVKRSGRSKTCLSKSAVVVVFALESIFPRLPAEAEMGPHPLTLTGPTTGHILRPSQGKVDSLAWETSRVRACTTSFGKRPQSVVALCLVVHKECASLYSCYPLKYYIAVRDKMLNLRHHHPE